jgi:hypothetical protein
MNAFTALFCIFFLVVFIVSWKSHFFPGSSFGLGRIETAASCVIMAICAGGVGFVSLGWSANDVRNDSGELIFYLVFSLIWIVLTQLVFEVLGVGLRDDAVERKNRGALFAMAGLTIGATCCVAGANVGNGPGPEAVFFCMALSTGTVLLLWTLLAGVTSLAEAITVERDLGAGLRASGFLASCGAICGAAVAGDWVSLGSTLRDFIRLVWPVLGGFILVVAFELKFNRRPLAGRLSANRSAVIAGVLFMVAAAYALWVVKQ